MVANSAMNGFPPFPSNVGVAPIASASLAKLLASDPAESKKIFTACQTHGFFYLDLTDASSGQTLLSESEQLLAVSHEAFSAPLDEKEKFAIVKGVSIFGYKEAGTVKKTDPNLRPDSTEFFNIGKDHIHGFTASRAYPPCIEEQQPLLKDFTKNAHELGMTILGTLAQELGLEPSALTDRNIFTSPSGDHRRLTKKKPHPTDGSVIGLPSHTDFGSITILFNWLGGLQIQSHDPKKLGEWEYVKPVPGNAIINLGDAMVMFTNGALKSAKHRVVPPPGDQANVDRYSIVYFVRPADDQLMQPVKGFEKQNGKVKVAGKFNDFLGGDTVHTAGEWMKRRTAQMGS